MRADAMLGWCARCGYSPYRCAMRDAAASAISFSFDSGFSRMNILMRTLKLLALGVLFAMGAARPVNAQTPTVDDSRFFFNVSFGGQWKEQTFTDSSTFTIYDEPTGANAAAHSIGGGTLFDFGIGVRRVWRSLDVGIAYSTLKNFNDATVSVRVRFTPGTTPPPATHLELSGSVALNELKVFTVPVTAGKKIRTQVQLPAGPFIPSAISRDLRRRPRPDGCVLGLPAEGVPARRRARGRFPQRSSAGRPSRPRNAVRPAWLRPVDRSRSGVPRSRRRPTRP